MDRAKCDYEIRGENLPIFVAKTESQMVLSLIHANNKPPHSSTECSNFCI
jgi:hypothetical protein